MSTEKKVKITAISTLLAFAVQLISFSWMLASMQADIRECKKEVIRVAEEQRKRTHRVYTMDIMGEKIKLIIKQFDELKADVRRLERSR